MPRLPVVFLGHGSPMIALQNNDTTRAWAAIASRIERDFARPTAILCVSAHWITRGIAVTAMARPRTIHDFGAFPQALFDVRYPAPGDPALAERVRTLLAPLPVTLDGAAQDGASGWGLDHGAWSVLCKLYPDADIPVVQLGMDGTQGPAFHFRVGRALRPLRDEGVLILGTGNIVHNLPEMDFANRDRAPYDWARRFNDRIGASIRDNRPERAIDFAALGEDARRSVPTPEHYWPLLYVLGARDDDDVPAFGPDHIEHGSLGMTSVVLSAPVAAA